MDWHSRINYPTVIPLFERLLNGVQSVLGERLLGLYVSGSLASGDYVPGRSDVDFVVATTSILPEELLPELAAMHRAVTTSGLALANHLEGMYVPRPALRRYDPSIADYPALRADGSFGVDHHGSDWSIQLHLLRKHGIPLVGPDPRELVDPVPPAELRRATVGILYEWWEPKLTDPTILHGADYQAYAVLTMCRVLYTVQHGDIVSKNTAARWARDYLGPQWSGLVDQAIHWREGLPFDRLDEILALIEETLRRCRASGL